MCKIIPNLLTTLIFLAFASEASSQYPDHSKYIDSIINSTNRKKSLIVLKKKQENITYVFTKAKELFAVQVRKAVPDSAVSITYFFNQEEIAKITLTIARRLPPKHGHAYYYFFNGEVIKKIEKEVVTLEFETVIKQGHDLALKARETLLTKHEE